MLEKSDWSHLIPHQGLMCLLDEVVAWDDTHIHARSDSHRRDDNPLRSDGMLRALHLCEYGAQSMAVHGALLARASGAAASSGY
ncbi:MAG: phosphotransferase, partial [Dokdonella sp.]